MVDDPLSAEPTRAREIKYETLNEAMEYGREKCFCHQHAVSKTHLVLWCAMNPARPELCTLTTSHKVAMLGIPIASPCHGVLPRKSASPCISSSKRCSWSHHLQNLKKVGFKWGGSAGVRTKISLGDVFIGQDNDFTRG